MPADGYCAVQNQIPEAQAATPLGAKVAAIVKVEDRRRSRY
jgi:hypothetical protein